MRRCMRESARDPANGHGYPAVPQRCTRLTSAQICGSCCSPCRIQVAMPLGASSQRRAVRCTCAPAHALPRASVSSVLFAQSDIARHGGRVPYGGQRKIVKKSPQRFSVEARRRRPESITATTLIGAIAQNGTPTGPGDVSIRKRCQAVSRATHDAREPSCIRHQSIRWCISTVHYATPSPVRLNEGAPTLRHPYVAPPKLTNPITRFPPATRPADH